MTAMTPELTGAMRRIDGLLRSGDLPTAQSELAALSLTPHALAPVAELPVLQIVSAIHILADLTLGLGDVVHDYLRRPTERSLSGREMGHVL